MASLHLRLISDGSNQQVTTYRFTESGGSVGRSQDCDWTLNDTERFISNKHIIIAYVNGAFLVTDTSSNGTFVNNNEQPLGKGNSYNLQVKDIVKLGTFSIQVTDIDLAKMNATLINPTPAPQTESQPGDLLGLVTGNSATSNHSTSDVRASSKPDTSKGELGLFDILSGDLPTTPSSPSVSEQSVSQPSSPPAETAFSPIGNGNTIPDNWDLDEESPVTPAPTQASPKPASTNQVASRVQPPITSEIAAVNEASKQPETPEPTPQQPQVPEVSATDSPTQPQGDFFSMLYEKLGLPKEYIQSVDQTEFANELVQVLMTSTQGIMALLAGRSVLKQESRLNMTMIKPQSNNPIKFSLDPTDTLEMLLVKKKPGYLSAQAAYAEAMNDVQLHQMAFLSGLQAALDGVLSELDPEKLAQEAEEKGRGFIGLKANAQKWQTFTSKQEKLRKQVKENLNDLLAAHFSAAYEAHINNAKHNN